MSNVTILIDDPTIIPLADMHFMPGWERSVVDWVRAHRPECLDDDDMIFPHPMYEASTSAPEHTRDLTHNELLVELAGRKCYDSFGLKAGRKTNREYIENTQASDVPHASIMYHAKMSFFFAGISRRVSHEIIRNYVGADRDEEGSPSQESTRFTHHYGFFILPPRYMRPITEVPGAMTLAMHFKNSMQQAYDAYLSAVNVDVDIYTKVHNNPPKGMERKRIYEAASSFLPHQAETSFVWTTNPAAIAKFCKERDNEAADLEIQRFARKWKRVCVQHWPNLFPQKHMREGT